MVNQGSDPVQAENQPKLSSPRQLSSPDDSAFLPTLPCPSLHQTISSSSVPTVIQHETNPPKQVGSGSSESSSNDVLLASATNVKIPSVQNSASSNSQKMAKVLAPTNKEGGGLEKRMAQGRKSLTSIVEESSIDSHAIDLKTSQTTLTSVHQDNSAAPASLTVSRHASSIKKSPYNRSASMRSLTSSNTISTLSSQGVKQLLEPKSSTHQDHNSLQTGSFVIAKQISNNFPGEHKALAPEKLGGEKQTASAEPGSGVGSTLVNTPSARKLPSSRMRIGTLSFGSGEVHPLNSLDSDTMSNPNSNFIPLHSSRSKGSVSSGHHLPSSARSSNSRQSGAVASSSSTAKSSYRDEATNKSGSVVRKLSHRRTHSGGSTVYASRSSRSSKAKMHSHHSKQHFSAKDQITLVGKVHKAAHMLVSTISSTRTGTIRSSVSSASKKSSGAPHSTALHLAVRDGDILATEALLQRGLDINLKDDRGYTPLHVAVISEQEITMLELLKAKADLNACDGMMNTALHLALIERKHEIASSLLSRCPTKLVFHAKNLDGKTPYDLILEAKSESMTFACLERCSKTSFVDTLKGKIVETTFFLDPLLDMNPATTPPSFLTYPPTMSDDHYNPCSPLSSALYATLKAKLGLTMGHPVLRVLIEAKWQTYGRRHWTNDFVRYLFFLLIYVVCGYLHNQCAPPSRFSHFTSRASHRSSNPPFSNDNSGSQLTEIKRFERQINLVVFSLTASSILFFVSFYHFSRGTIAFLQDFGLQHTLRSVWTMCRALMETFGMLSSLLFIVELIEHSADLALSPYAAPPDYKPFPATGSLLSFGVALAFMNGIKEVGVFSTCGTFVHVIELLLEEWAWVFLGFTLISVSSVSVGVVFAEHIEAEQFLSTGLKNSFMFLFARRQGLQLLKRNDAKLIKCWKVFVWDVIIMHLFTTVMTRIFKASFEKAKLGSLMSKGHKLVEYELHMTQQEYRQENMKVCPKFIRQQNKGSIYAEVLSSLTVDERLRIVSETIARIEKHLTAFHVSLERNLSLQATLSEELNRCQFDILTISRSLTARDRKERAKQDERTKTEESKN